MELLHLLFWICFTGVLIINSVNSCNEAICGSVVSKCLLTQSCQCNLPSCHCCKECFHCLGSLFSECCSCLDLCPQRNNTEGSSLNKKSSVEDFKEPLPELFSVLTEMPDAKDRWSVIKLPVEFDVSHYETKKETFTYMTSADKTALPKSSSIFALNCTVAFISECLGMNKCKKSCRSMGANSYRWFHDGCCECVGEYCINYGISESKCLKCPDGKEVEEPEDYAEAEYDYGEDEPLDDD